LVLEAEADAGVDGGGDADVGVAEEFLEDDECDSLLQEQRRRRMAKVMKRVAAAVDLVLDGGGPFKSVCLQRPQACRSRSCKQLQVGRSCQALSESASVWDEQ
jgi:hypothetical protein